MKRKLAYLLACIALLAAACSKPAGDRQPIYVFTDSAGKQVNIYEAPRRVAVLLASYAEIWKISGGEIAVTVGDSVERGFADGTAELVDGGAGMNIDVEKLAALRPDFVIGSADMPAQVAACERLGATGIPCALFKEETFGDYLYMLKIFSDINGNADAYYEYGQAVGVKIADILSEAEENAAADEVSVLFIRAGSGGSSTRAKTAENHFVGVMLKELGTFNIADEAKQLSEALSLEHVLIKQPDVILISTQGDEQAAVSYMTDVLSEPGWRELRAVKYGKVYFLPKNMFHYKPNALWGDAYAYLYDLLYGEGVA